MIANVCARLRASTFAACSALALTVALTGCNVEAHDTIDTPASSSVPIPANAPVPASANLPASLSAQASNPKPSAVPPPPSDADMGMPVYPNATTYVDAIGNFIKFDNSGGMAIARLQTNDSVDSVIAFYKSKIVQTNLHGAPTPATPSEEKQAGKRKVVLIGNDAAGNTQMVEAREEEGKTAIELMTTKIKLPESIPDANKSGETSVPASSPGAGLPSLPSSSGNTSLPSSGGKSP